MTAKTHNAAQLLMLSAMALPAMADAAEVPDKTDIQYRFTQYQEGDVSPVSGASERYSIDVHQLRVLAPIGGKIAMEVDLVDEVMSGASPWGTQGNEKGEADLIMSGASIAEARRDLSIKFRHYYDRAQWNYHLGSSSENDYQSFYAGTDSELAFNKNNTYLGMGISGSQDFISPTDAELYNRTPSEQKSSASGYLSLSQVLSKNSVAQFGFSFTGYTGYLSDPYKLGDQRPSNKQEQTATLMYRHFLPGPNAALHLDYRFYQDSWQLSSHTIAIRWYQNLGARMQLVPALRYYSQTEAFFYEPYQVAANPQLYYSSDYRLSPFGSVSVGLGFYHHFNHWSCSIRAEHYRADAVFSGRPIAIKNPALLQFSKLTLGLNVNW